MVGRVAAGLRCPGGGGMRALGQVANGGVPVADVDDEAFGLGHWVPVFERLFAPHPSHVTLIGLDGTVLAVNEAWRQYGRANGLPDSYDCVGRNYLDVCEAGVAAGAPSAQEIYVGLLGVLRGGRPKFTTIYPCHSPARREWHRMWVEPQSPSVPAVIVAHQPVATRPWARGEPDGDVGRWIDRGPSAGRVDAAGVGRRAAGGAMAWPFRR